MARIVVLASIILLGAFFVMVLNAVGDVPLTDSLIVFAIMVVPAMVLGEIVSRNKRLSEIVTRITSWKP
jgi:hypothetical protein